MSVPNLRFKADDGSDFLDWEEHTLADVSLEFKSGKSIPSSGITKSGLYPVYGGNGLRGYTNAYNHEGIYVVIGRQGALCGNVSLVYGKTYLTEHAVAVQANYKNDTLFLSYLLGTMKLRQYSDQSAQPGLAVNKLIKLKKYFPSLPEQRKIAAFLSTIDEIITTTEAELNAWQERKKGVMQKIFNREVRFKADDGSEFPEWEEKTVSDLFLKITDKNTKKKVINVITNSAEFGLVRQRDFFDKDIAVEGKTDNYTIIQQGDFVYNPRKSKQAPYGPFNCYHLNEEGIVSPLYMCLRPIGKADNDYLYWYFQTDRWYRFIYENGAQNGARHDRVGMTDDLMQNIPIYLPSDVSEQKRIADCLSSLDDVINQIQAELSAWKEFKKGLLQQMFI